MELNQNKSQKKNQRRKFIAGAVCPECQALDRLVLIQQGEQLVRECVSCGFSEELASEPAYSLPNSIKDRTPGTSGPGPSNPGSDNQIVRILDP